MDNRKRPLSVARKKRIFTRALPLGVALIVLIAVILFGPWGPLGDSLFSGGKGGASTGAENETETNGEEDSGLHQESKTQETHEKESNPDPPSVAIVVDDVGTASDKIPIWTGIDAPICFSVMPYCEESGTQAEELHRAGFVVMMHIPTENQPPNSYSGKGQLSTGMDRQTVFSTLDSDLSTIPHVSGINNHQGGLGCDDLQLMTYECEWAREKGFFVVDSSSSYHSKVSQASTGLGMGRRKNQVFIDHHNDPEYIRGAMRELADLARESGTAIGICHWNRPYTASVVAEMVEVLKAEGVNFAFARDITN